MNQKIGIAVILVLLVLGGLVYFRPQAGTSTPVQLGSTNSSSENSSQTTDSSQTSPTLTTGNIGDDIQKDLNDIEKDLNKSDSSLDDSDLNF